MSIRGKTIGQMQVGLSSEDNPVVTPLTSQSLLPIGLTIIGTNSAVPSSSIFMCTGKLRVSYRNTYSASGLIQIPYKSIYMSVGYFIGKHHEMYFRATGDLSVSDRLPIRMTGVVRQQALSFVKSIGILGYPSDTLVRIIGICKANYSKVFRTSGVLQRKQLNPIRVTAVCKANYDKLVKTIGLIVYEHKDYFRAVGSIATLAQSFVQLTGTLRQLDIAPFKTIGSLANTTEHNFVKIVGKINIAAFVAAVPKKVQEFVTNKKWWR